MRCRVVNVLGDEVRRLQRGAASDTTLQCNCAVPTGAGAPAAGRCRSACRLPIGRVPVTWSSRDSPSANQMAVPRAPDGGLLPRFFLVAGRPSSRHFRALTPFFSLWPMINSPFFFKTAWLTLVSTCWCHFYGSRTFFGAFSAHFFSGRGPDAAVKWPPLRRFSGRFALFFRSWSLATGIIRRRITTPTWPYQFQVAEPINGRLTKAFSRFRLIRIKRIDQFRSFLFIIDVIAIQLFWNCN